eukprot:762931-Hanusia_phi.AAC.3
MRSSPLFDPSPRPREQGWTRDRRTAGRDAAPKQEKRQALPQPSSRSAEHLYRSQAQGVEVGRPTGEAGAGAGSLVHDVVSQRLEQLFQEFQVDGPLLDSIRGALLASE